MRSPSIHPILSVAMAISLALGIGTAQATPAQEAELEKLDKIEAELTLQREWADYRWKKTTAECYQTYFVNRCLSQARAQYRKEIDPIRAQEVELNTAQRELRKLLKDERDAKRKAEKADPAKAAERAENVRAFEEKQQDAAKRAADLEERRKDAPRRAQENKAGTQLQ
ncbi:MAG: hypothetical protein NBV55_02060 [Polynucleobacter sp.]|nr:hypothetical protein [Polynucleobacter sp.]